MSRAIVMLVGEPFSTSAKTKPAPGRKIDFASAATQSFRAELNDRRKRFKAWLRANAPKVKVTGEFDISLNAVSVELNGTTLDVLRRAPQAARIELESVYTPLATARTRTRTCL